MTSSLDETFPLRASFIGPNRWGRDLDHLE
jgi:hypothetical protein